MSLRIIPLFMLSLMLTGCITIEYADPSPSIVTSFSDKPTDMCYPPTTWTSVKVLRVDGQAVKPEAKSFPLTAGVHTLSLDVALEADYDYGKGCDNAPTTGRGKVGNSVLNPILSYGINALVNNDSTCDKVTPFHQVVEIKANTTVKTRYTIKTKIQCHGVEVWIEGPSKKASDVVLVPRPIAS